MAELDGATPGRDGRGVSPSAGFARATDWGRPRRGSSQTPSDMVLAERGKGAAAETAAQ